jgi:2-phospho-L-lactate guanylyltransferase
MTRIHKQGSTWALVPLKSREAKSRLAPLLNPEQRKSLFFELAERVIGALHATRGIDAVAVVTASQEVAIFARALHAVPIIQSADAGMSPALNFALTELRGRQLHRVLIVPADLPLITSAALERLLVAGGAGPGVVLVPDRRGVGTNALLCCPPDVLSPCFGGHSFERHRIAAEAAAVEVRVLEVNELALDLDCPEDVEYLRRLDAPIARLSLEARCCVAGE